MAITYPINLPSGLDPTSVMITPSDVVARAVSPFTLQEQIHRHQGQQWQLALTYKTTTKNMLDLWAATLLRLKGQYGTFLFGDPSKRSPSGVATGTPLVDAPTVIIATNATSTASTLNFASTTGVRDGMAVSGTGITAGSYVVSHTSTTVVINWPIAASVASGTSVTFSGMSGDYLYTKGWSNGVTGILKAGDYIQIGTGSATTLYRLTADSDSDSSGYAALEVWPQVRQGVTAPNDGATIITSNTVGRFRLDKSTGWKITPPVIGEITINAHEAL